MSWQRWKASHFGRIQHQVKKSTKLFDGDNSWNLKIPVNPPGDPILSKLWVFFIGIVGFLEKIHILRSSYFSYSLEGNVHIFRRWQKKRKFRLFSSMLKMQSFGQIHLTTFEKYSKRRNNSYFRSRGEGEELPILVLLLVGWWVCICAVAHGPCNVDYPTGRQADIMAAPHMKTR